MAPKFSSKAIRSVPALALALAILAPGPAVGADNPSDLLESAAYEFSRGEYKKAAKNYRKALKENPQDPHAYLGLGMALKSEGELKEAQAVLEELTELYPDFAPAYYNLGEVLEARGDQQAREAYKKYLEYSGGQLPPDPQLRIKFRKMGLI